MPIHSQSNGSKVRGVFKFSCKVVDKNLSCI